MNTFVEGFYFLKEYQKKTLLKVTTLMPNRLNGFIGSEVLLDFDDGAQLLISCDYTFFENPLGDKDEDVLFSIEEARGYEAFCNIVDAELSVIRINEKIASLSIVYDEVSFPRKQDTYCFYPVAFVFTTERRKFSIWRDLLIDDLLLADYDFGQISHVFAPEERWGGYDLDCTFHVIRRACNIFDGSETIIKDVLVENHAD